MASLMLIRLLFVVALAQIVASDSFISDRVMQQRGSIGRSLLQAKKPCPVNFEFMNYTIITSQCKGPQYPAKQCCSAFKEFACPYADYLNDGSNECASTMFSYINLYGRYPPGLFASECKEGKEGLACPPSSQSANDTSSAFTNSGFSRVISISTLFISVAFLLH